MNFLPPGKRKCRLHTKDSSDTSIFCYIQRWLPLVSFSCSCFRPVNLHNSLMSVKAYPFRSEWRGGSANPPASTLPHFRMIQNFQPQVPVQRLRRAPTWVVSTNYQMLTSGRALSLSWLLSLDPFSFPFRVSPSFPPFLSLPPSHNTVAWISG